MLETSASKPAILLAAHDSDTRQRILSALKEDGHCISAANDEDHAAELTEQLRPHLMVIDSDMPDQGAERLVHLARSASKNGPGTYILALGQGSSTDGSQPDLVIEKPIHLGSLRRHIQQALSLLRQDEELFHGAAQDLPSGLLHHQAFDRFYHILRAQFLRSGGSGVLLFIEWTNRAELYHRHGVRATYALEAEIARRLVTLHRSSDFASRLSPGRFCLLLTNTTSLQAHTVVMRAASVLQELHIPSGAQIKTDIRPRLCLSLADFPKHECATSAQDIMAVKAVPVLETATAPA